MKVPEKKVKLLIYILFAAYCFVVLWLTLIGRKTSYAVNMFDSPFWEYKKLFIDGQISMLHDILLNIAMFVPFGILMQINCIGKFKFTLFSALLFSTFIEFAQLFLQCGWCEIDDIFNNTLGACLGYFIYKTFYMRIRKKMKI